MRQVAAAVLFALVLVSIVVTLRSTVVFRAGVAASDNLIVYGYIFDSNGDPVEGADVVLTVIGSKIPYPTQPTVSIVGGFYTVTFDMIDWQLGDTVRVESSFGGESGLNQTTADSANLVIDVHMVSSIPELGGPLSVMLTVSSMAAIVVIVARRRR